MLVTLHSVEVDHQFAFRLGRLGFDNIMVVAMRAVLVRLFNLLGLFAEDLLAFLANHDDFGGQLQLVVLCLCVALRAVEPLLAAGSSNGDLRVQNVFAH